jgi:hypothetical protein
MVVGPNSPAASSLEKPERAVNEPRSNKMWTAIGVVCNLRGSQATNELSHASEHDLRDAHVVCRQTGSSSFLLPDLLKQITPPTYRSTSEQS